MNTRQRIDRLFEAGTHEAQIEKAVEAHFPLPPDIRFYSNAANFDLYMGPRDSIEDDPFPWKGFVHATKLVRDWNDDNLHDVWYDTQSGEVTDHNPENHFEPAEPEPVEDPESFEAIHKAWEEQTNGNYEMYLQDFYALDVQDVKRYIYGRELAPYV
jgi:hypothetical protein